MADPTSTEPSSDIWFGKVARRDKIAHHLANIVIKTIGTKRYDAQLTSLFEYAVRSGIRDYLEHRDPPPPLEELVVKRDALAREEMSKRERSLHAS